MAVGGLDLILIALQPLDIRLLDRGDRLHQPAAILGGLGLAICGGCLAGSGAILRGGSRLEGRGQRIEPCHALRIFPLAGEGPGRLVIGGVSGRRSVFLRQGRFQQRRDRVVLPFPNRGRRIGLAR